MPRPIILGVVGDSAAGKTTITRGLVRVLGEEQRHARLRRRLPPLRPPAARRARTSRRCTPTATTWTSWPSTSPTCARGEPFLKPVYRTRTARSGRPSASSRSQFTVVEGLLGYYTADAARPLRRARLPRAARGAAAQVEGAARLLAPRLHDRPGARPSSTGASPTRRRSSARSSARRHRRLVPARRRAATRSTSTPSSCCATASRTPTSRR